MNIKLQDYISVFSVLGFEYNVFAGKKKPMCDMRAKLVLRLCLFTSIYLTATDCSWLPKKYPARSAFKLKHQQPALQKPSMYKTNIFGTDQMTNREFCVELILRPEDHYIVLPWWYNYCEDLRKKYPKGVPGNVDLNIIEKYVEDEARLYKQRMDGKDVQMSELENELIEINHAKAEVPA